MSVRFGDHPGRQDQAVSFIETRDGRIAPIREFWPEPFAPADWRAPFVERVEPG